MLLYQVSNKCIFAGESESTFWKRASGVFWSPVHPQFVVHPICFAFECLWVLAVGKSAIQRVSRLNWLSIDIWSYYLHLNAKITATKIILGTQKPIHDWMIAVIKVPRLAMTSPKVSAYYRRECLLSRARIESKECTYPDRKLSRHRYVRHSCIKVLPSVAGSSAKYCTPNVWKSLTEAWAKPHISVFILSDETLANFEENSRRD